MRSSRRQESGLTSVSDVRYLVIVKRGERRLLHQAVLAFAHRPYVRVIYDRREGERRRNVGAPRVDRRQADRRIRSQVDAEISEYGSTMVRTDPT